MAVAGLGDRTPPFALATGVLSRHQTQVAHQLPRATEPPEVVQLRHQADGGHGVDPPEAPQPPHRLPIRLLGTELPELPLELHQPLAELINRQQIATNVACWLRLRTAAAVASPRAACPSCSLAGRRSAAAKTCSSDSAPADPHPIDPQRLRSCNAYPRSEDGPRPSPSPSPNLRVRLSVLIRALGRTGSARANTASSFGLTAAAALSVDPPQQHSTARPPPQETITSHAPSRRLLPLLNLTRTGPPSATPQSSAYGHPGPRRW
jgi:hypothetical protein